MITTTVTSTYRCGIVYTVLDAATVYLTIGFSRRGNPKWVEDSEIDIFFPNQTAAEEFAAEVARQIYQANPELASQVVEVELSDEELEEMAQASIAHENERLRLTLDRRDL